MRRGTTQSTCARVATAAALAAGCVAASACGEATVPKHAVARVTVAKSTVHAPLSAAAAKHRAVVARVDASSDQILAEGKVHIAQGAPSDAEVRREIKALRKAGIALPSGDSAASFAQANAAAAVAGVETPETVWNPRSKPIATWIIAVLQWAYQHGWTGTVTSGYRSYYEQVQLNAAGAFSAPAGFSNHETAAYPGGAVDVTNPSQLSNVLRNYPGPEKLVGGVLGPVDPEHFSATGD